MKNLSYRQKNRIMATAAAVLLLVVAGFSVRKTIALVHQNARLVQRIALAQQGPEQIAQLEARSAQMGKVLAIGVEERGLRRELFEKAGRYCQQYQVQLTSLEESETFEEDLLQIETHELSLEGNFTDQLRVCHALEESLTQGRIASLVFHTVRDRRRKQVRLNGYLYIQGVKEVKHED